MRRRSIGLLPVPAPFPENPYLSMFYDALAKAGVRIESDRRFGPAWVARHRGDVDVVHFHWLNGYYEKGGLLPSVAGFAFLAARLLALRLSGFRLLWTVHNLESHENPRPWLDRAATRLMTALADRLLVHGEAARGLVAEAFGQPPDRVVAIHHGNFLEVMPPIPERAEARGRLGIDRAAFVYLHFGKIRAYKGVDELLAAYARERRPGDLLAVVGRPERDATALAASLHAAAGVRAELDFVTDARLADYLAACDCVVLPYRRILTSGSLVMALGAGRPVVCPDEATLVETGGAQALLAYGPGGLASALVAIRERDRDAMGQAARARAEALAWEPVAAHVLAALEAMCPER